MTTNAFDAVDQWYHDAAKTSSHGATPESIQPIIQSWMQQLLADPLLIKYCEHTQGGHALNTKPEHAFGERLQSTFHCLLAAKGEIDISCPSWTKEPRLTAAGLATMLSKCTAYLWSDKMEKIADAAPLPTHTVSRNVLPYPLMFWSRETRYESKDGWANNWIAMIHHIDHCFFIGDATDGEKMTLVINAFKYGGVWPNDYDADPELGRLLKRCAFLSSPYVVTERRRLPHHVRRQLERDHGTPRQSLQEEMHVVNLRRAQIRQPQHHEGDKTVEWKHQWWVSAHYRAQWYASEKAHKVIWIAPYLKGPDDKPIIEKVYAVTR